MDKPDLDLTVSPFPCDRRDFPNGRFYHRVLDEPPEDEKEWLWFPSVTTIKDAVLSKGLHFRKWLVSLPSWTEYIKILDESGNLGTTLHNIFMKMIWGKRIDLSDPFYDEETDSHIDISGNEYAKRLMCFDRFWNDYSPIPIATEIMLFNPTLQDDIYETPFAGQPDLICLIEGKNGGQERWLIDWKTGKNLYPDFALQLTGYKLLWDAIFPNEPIERMGVIHLKDSWIKEPSGKIHEYKFSPDAWFGILQLWNWLGNGTPKFPAEYPKVFDLYEEIEEENE